VVLESTETKKAGPRGRFFIACVFASATNPMNVLPTARSSEFQCAIIESLWAPPSGDDAGSALITGNVEVFMRMALMLASFSSFAAVAEAGDAQGFREQTKTFWAECSWRADVAAMPFAGASALQRASDCVERATIEAERTYQASPASLQSILQPYYMTWRTEMESLENAHRKSKTVAERSLAQSAKQLDDAWAAAEDALRNPSLQAKDQATAQVTIEQRTSPAPVGAKPAGNL
jgi:hypothetical protein